MIGQRERLGWLRAARYLLDPHDVSRVIEPTLADALHERTLANDHRTWLWQSRWHLVCALGGALQYRVQQRFLGASWFGFVALVLAALSGAVVLKQGPTPSTALNQCVFLVMAALLGMFIVIAPSTLLRNLGTLSILLAAVSFSLCPWCGVTADGHRQWIQLGALQVHIATLYLPAFVTFVRRTLHSRRLLWLTGGSLGVTGLLLLQQNGLAAVVYALVVTGTLLERSNTYGSWIMAAALGFFAIITIGQRYAIVSWSTLGLLALIVAIGWTIHRGFVARKSGVRAAQTVSLALVTLSVLRGLDGDTLPVIGFGGSAVVAFFVLIALQMRTDMDIAARGRSAD